MKKRAVIYARYSSFGQTEQSIEGQLRECYSFAERNEIMIVDEYIDRAMTGTSDHRPNFQRMIEDSKKKAFEYVLVYQLDRFARNRYDSAIYKSRLKKNGVRVISARENITDDASGILVEGMLESMAEYFSAELSQKVKRGINESLLKGNCLGGYVLLGYEIKDKKLVINEKEAGIVRGIFSRYKDGQKAKEIADYLNACGIRTKRGKPFTVNIIAKTIRNKKYTGKLYHEEKVFDNIFPRIIDDATFERCNKIMDGYKHKARDSKDDIRYLLSGKLYCACCGAQMTAETGTSHTGNVYRYYKCFNRKRDKESCKKENYPKDELEELVISKTEEYVLKAEVIGKIAEETAKRYNESIKEPQGLISMENRLKDVDKSINGIMSAIEQGIITKTTKERMFSLEREKEELENKIGIEKSRRAKPISAENVKSFMSRFIFPKSNIANRKKFFNGFINRVYLSDEKAYIYCNASDYLPSGTDENGAIDGGKVIPFPPPKGQKNNISFERFKRDALV